LRLGEFVEVEGVTDPSQFAPIVISTRVVALGLGQMPEPIRPNRDQLLNGSLDGQYVEVQGVVTAVEPGEIRGDGGAIQYMPQVHDERGKDDDHPRRA